VVVLSEAAEAAVDSMVEVHTEAEAIIAEEAMVEEVAEDIDQSPKTAISEGYRA
jgi:hypothetical protein